MKEYYFGDLPLRTYFIDGEVWYIGKDLGKIMGYKRERGALQRHVEPKDKMLHEVTDPNGKPTVMIIINTEGALSLINASKFEWVRAIRHWFNTQVIPDVNKRIEFQRKLSEYHEWFEKGITFKELCNRFKMDANVLRDFLINHKIMDDRGSFLGKARINHLVVGNKFTRIGINYIDGLLYSEGFKHCECQYTIHKNGGLQ